MKVKAERLVIVEQSQRIVDLELIVEGLLQSREEMLLDMREVYLDTLAPGDLMMKWGPDYWCGVPIPSPGERHGNHSAIPMGCECGFVKDR